MLKKFKSLVYFFAFLVSTPLSSQENLHNYATLFAELPQWELKAAELTPFGEGMTNQNFLLKLHQKKYFVRMGSPSREALGTNAERERLVTLCAASMGLAPPVLVEDLNLGILVMPFIESQKIDLHEESELKRAIKLLKIWHNSSVELPFSSHPEQLIVSYLNQLDKLQISLTLNLKTLIDSRPKLSPATLVPCHLDMWSKNVLDDGQRLWLIDWEYGAMCDPLFDLASLSSAEFFTDEEMERLLIFYDPLATKESHNRLRQWRILADIRWGLWALIQKKCSTLNFSFDNVAQTFFEQAEKRLFE